MISRNLIPAKVPVTALNSRKVHMNAGSMAIPYHGNGMNSDDNNNDEQ